MSSAMLLGIGLIVGILYAGAPAEAAKNETATEAAGNGGAAAVTATPALRDLEARVTEVQGAWAQAARYYDAEVAPIERVLLRYRDDDALARRVAVSLVRESNRLDLDPRLLLAVLLVENPWLDPSARSSVGAVGLMQVMPMHLGTYPECGNDLEDIDSNICYGARLFTRYFRESHGGIESALLRYNGCVHGTNTPTCRQYPSYVFARAGRASVLAWMGTTPAAASR